jgi:ribosomal protein S18 acetylase RimI-like enzyme
MIHYEIRSVEICDLERCLTTIHAAFGDMAERYGYTKETYPSSGAYLTIDDLRSAKERGVHMYAAWIKDTVAGYVQLEKIRDGVYAFRRFAVLPEYQNLGFGRALIKHCQKKAASYGGRKLLLIMNYDNTVLRAFYESNGFRLIDTGNSPDYPFTFANMELEL